jgi:hypothetical protein
MFGIETLPSLAIERPQVVMAIGGMIKRTILEMAPTLGEQEVRELFFQWSCIVHGFITMALILEGKTSPAEGEWQPEQFLERATLRFIKSLS